MSDSKQPHKDQIDKLLKSKKAHERQLTPEILFEKIENGDKAGLSEAKLYLRVLEVKTFQMHNYS